MKGVEDGKPFSLVAAVWAARAAKLRQSKWNFIVFLNMRRKQLLTLCSSLGTNVFWRWWVLMLLYDCWLPVAFEVWNVIITLSKPCLFGALVQIILHRWLMTVMRQCIIIIVLQKCCATNANLCIHVTRVKLTISFWKYIKKQKTIIAVILHTGYNINNPIKCQGKSKKAVKYKIRRCLLNVALIVGT